MNKDMERTVSTIVDEMDFVKDVLIVCTGDRRTDIFNCLSHPDNKEKLTEEHRKRVADRAWGEIGKIYDEDEKWLNEL